MTPDRPARRSLGPQALCLLALSCDVGMLPPDPRGTTRVGPHEIEVADAEPTTVTMLVDLESTKPITAYVGVAIEGVVIDRGPPDDIDMQLDCDGDGPSMTTTVLSGQTNRADASDLALPTELECTLTFTPRDPLAAPVFIQWLTAVEVAYGGKDRDAGLVVHIDVMAPEP